MGKVIFQSSGLHTSLQDLGRYGFRKYGVPISGAMDHLSFKLANLLVNNPENTAVLEITQIGPSLKFDSPAMISITGANLSPQLNGSPITNNKAIEINSGDLLSFGAPMKGTRAYLSIQGGFHGETVINSQSMYPIITTKSLFNNGDELAYDSPKPSSKNYAKVSLDKEQFESSFLEVFPGPEYDWLDEQTKSVLLNEQFVIGTNNRMGYQLSNPKMTENELQMLTSPVVPGTIQLTPSGKLMALMRDAQVTGGYPRILQMTKESINRLAQKGSRHVVRFKLSDF